MCPNCTLGDADASDSGADSFAGVLQTFGSLRSLAQHLGVPYPTVTAWKRRNSIPESRWRQVEQAARVLKVPDVHYQRLADIAAKQRGEIVW